MYRTAGKIEMRTQLVFQEPAVRLPDVLREVAEEGE